MIEINEKIQQEVNQPLQPMLLKKSDGTPVAVDICQGSESIQVDYSTLPRLISALQELSGKGAEGEFDEWKKLNDEYQVYRQQVIKEDKTPEPFKNWVGLKSIHPQHEGIGAEGNWDNIEKEIELLAKGYFETDEHKSLDKSFGMAVGARMVLDHLKQNYSLLLTTSAPREGEFAEWVRVEDMLPDDFHEVNDMIECTGKYQLLDKSGEVHTGWLRRYKNDFEDIKSGHSDWQSRYTSHRDITHWKPLPAHINTL